MDWLSIPGQVLIATFIVTQILYTLTFLVDGYLFTRPINLVDVDEAQRIPAAELPFIVLFYPVLHELEATMRTTFGALDRLDYPKDRFQVIAVPNSDDDLTLACLKRLQREFAFLDIRPTPPSLLDGGLAGLAGQSRLF